MIVVEDSNGVTHCWEERLAPEQEAPEMEPPDPTPDH